MADGSIVLVEIKRGTVTQVTPDGRKSVLAETGGGPNGAAVGPDGALYIANNGGMAWVERGGALYPRSALTDQGRGAIQRIDLRTGTVSTLYDSWDGKQLLCPNDLVFDREGGMWFTDHGCETSEGRKFGALYYARADGSRVVRARGHFISPNGVGLSPDETVVYMSDTYLGRLWAFDIAAPGKIKPPEGFVPGRVVCNLQGYQLLDSLAVEAGGKVCVATLINGGITIFDSDGSTEHVPFPDVATSNICFGGIDMRDAWVTCASTGKLYKCRWPRPGLKLNFNL